MTTRSRRAGVEDRWSKKVRDEHGNTQTVPSSRHGKGTRWLARYVDDGGREHAKAFATKGEANEWLQTVMSALVTGTYVDPQSGKVTFASFYADWSARQIWEGTTRRAMDLAANSVPFSGVPLAELRPSHIEAWVKAMQDRDKPLAPGTIKTRFQNIRSIIRAAVRDRVMAHDVTAGIRLPRVRAASKAMTIPSPADVGALLQSADGPFVAFVALCAFAGLRLGEAAALQVSDVDFLRREIHVRRQVQRAGHHRVEIRAPKYGSERTVYAPEALLEVLSEHIAAVCPTGPADRWMFPGHGADPMTHDPVGTLWKKASAAAGVDCRLHDLRHFYASGLISAGCDVVTVQRALGHHSATVTLSTYAHLWPDASDRTRKAAGELFAACAEPAANQLRTESP
ncbi:MAG: tyrosine-type recombinase/integrase [Mycobacterium sp.]